MGEGPVHQDTLGPVPQTDSVSHPRLEDTAASIQEFGFASRPGVKAYPGKAWQYRPNLNRPGAFTLRILKAPDSSMRIENGQVSWSPQSEGRFPVTLEASLSASPEGGAPERATQEFVLTVERVLTLALKTLPSKVAKGAGLTFDLTGSVFPAWASNLVTVRFDYDGNGTWETGALPLAANLRHAHAYDAIGRFTPKIEARYGEFEVRTVEGAVLVEGSIMPILKISPDTVEPGGEVTVDASGSKADGRLGFTVDLDGDGNPEWSDSTIGRAILKAPGSGLYQATLKARNSIGQEGKAKATLRVNARPRLDLTIQNPVENMAAPVLLKARAKDDDDSLVQVRFNFTGEPGGWETRTTKADSIPGPGEWWLRFKHVYGKPGKYAASVCATSADGREACRQTAVTIFNAPPVCRPGPDLKGTLGKPLAIDGSGVDPDGVIVKWEWDLDGDGKFDLASSVDGRFQYTFTREGVFPLVLKVTTADGVSATGTRKVEVRKKWKS